MPNAMPPTMCHGLPCCAADTTTHATPTKLPMTPNAHVAECATSSRAEYALTIAPLAYSLQEPVAIRGFRYAESSSAVLERLLQVMHRVVRVFLRQLAHQFLFQGLAVVRTQFAQRARGGDYE